MGLEEIFKPMTNNEAADVIERFLSRITVYFARGNGSSLSAIEYAEAFAKAIAVLRETPDK